MLWAFRVCLWFQRLGIGERLLAWAEEICDTRGFTQVELGVETWNHYALRFYQKHGYQLCGSCRETLEYSTPDGQRKRWELDEWLLRKPVKI